MKGNNVLYVLFSQKFFMKNQVCAMYFFYEPPLNFETNMNRYYSNITHFDYKINILKM